MAEIVFKTAGEGNLIVSGETLKHLQTHKSVLQYLEEAAAKINVDGGFFRQEIDLGKPLSESGEVYDETPITPTTKTTFAYRQGRHGATRVVPAGTPSGVATSISIIAYPETDGSYVLITAFIGSLTPREPWDKNMKTDEEKQGALDFWCSCSLVHNPETMGAIFESTWEEEIAKVPPKK